MKTILGIVVAWCCLAASALGAEPPRTEPGREATVHLRDGTELHCLILGYEDGVLRFKRGDQVSSVKLGTVDRIVFGKAVGEFVRTPFEPPKPEGEPSAPAAAKHEERIRKALEDVLRAATFPQLVFIVSRWTNRFENMEAADRVEQGLKRMLNENKGEKGDLDKNLRLALATACAIQDKMPRVKELLGELRKDYPDDATVGKLQPMGLIFAIERTKHPGRLIPRRGPRPDRPPEAEKDPGLRDTPPPE